LDQDDFAQGHAQMERRGSHDACAYVFNEQSDITNHVSKATPGMEQVATAGAMDPYVDEDWSAMGAEDGVCGFEQLGGQDA